MAQNASRGGIEMEVLVGRRAGRARPEDATPFRVLVLGAFSGLSGRPVRERKPKRLELTELDDVMQRVAPRLELALAGGVTVEVQFEELDDFHPDALFDKLPVFVASRQLRKQLDDPATFAMAAGQIRDAPLPVEESPTGSAGSGEVIDETLERLLGKPASPQPGARAAQTTVERYVQSLVAPYVVDAPHPDKNELVAALDRATGDLMRAILHHPSYQELEAAWRGLDFLMRNVELDAGLDIFMLDMSREELATEVAQGSESPLHKLLVGESATGVPWALIVGDYTFACTQPDTQLLGGVAQWLAPGEAPLLTAGDYRSFSAGGGAEEAIAWEDLRKRAEASGIGLAMPRFLLRLPYGARTDPISRFAFEEQPDPPEAGRFLWGNPAFFVACVLGQSFVRSGWGFAVNETLEMNDLPVYTYRDAGEVVQTPCAEVWMGTTEADGLVARGYMPLCSVRGRDAARLLRVQSIASPPAPLAARWGGGT